MSNTDVNAKDLELELKCIKQEAEGMVKQMREIVKKNHRLRHGEKAEVIESLTDVINEAFFDLLNDVSHEIGRREETQRQKDLVSDVKSFEGEQY